VRRKRGQNHTQMWPIDTPSLLPLIFKMDSETKNFVENVDSWIKQIRAEFSQITDVSGIVEENVNNVQHNYELIYELKEQMEELKSEIKALKLMQLLQLKDGLIKRQH
jgi:predicted metal-dependent hydrolase